MKYSSLVGKIAADKDSKELGKIVGTKKLPRQLAHKNDKVDEKLIDYIVILVHRIFRKDVAVPIDSGRIMKIEHNVVWFDLSKKEFEQFISNADGIINPPKGAIQDTEKWNVKWSSFLIARDKQ